MVNLGLIWVFLYILFLQVLPGFQGVVLGLSFLTIGLYCITLSLLKDPNVELTKAPFVLLTVCGVIFGFLALCSRNFVNLYCCLEGLGLTTLFLVSRNYLRYGSKELFFKYFCFTSFSSLLFLLGLGLLYCLTTTFDFLTVKLIIFNFRNLFISTQALELTTLVLSLEYSLFFLATLFIIVSFCFKLGAFPFHFIIPELYGVASIPFLIYYTLFVKPIYLCIFVQLIYNVLEGVSQVYSNVLLASGLGSLCVGALGAFVQLSLWRLVGFAAIVQTGLILIGLSLNTLSNLAVVGIFFFSYLLTFVLFLAGMLWVSVFRSGSSPRLPTQYYIKSDLKLNTIIKDLSTQRWCMIILSVAMASSAALPPLIGFFSKYLLILSIITQESNLLLLFILLFNVLSSFYYLRVVSLIWDYSGVNVLYNTRTAEYFQRTVVPHSRPKGLLSMFPSWAALRTDLWVVYNFFSVYHILFLVSPLFLNSLLNCFYEAAFKYCVL